jgi:uncharacterized membrane protein YccF (DUF307 family)
MRLILNVIWLIFGGLWLALGYLLAALICFVLIITIPFGFAALRIASYALWPFGRTIIEKPGPRPGALIGNVIWVILFGIWLAIAFPTLTAAATVSQSYAITGYEYYATSTQGRFAGTAAGSAGDAAAYAVMTIHNDIIRERLITKLRKVATDAEKKQVSALVREFLDGFEADYRQEIKKRNE